MLIKVIGFLAALTSMISLVPQVIKMYQTHSVDDVSTLMILNFLLTSVFWITYGLLVNSLSVWFTNIFMLIFAILMICLKFKYRSKAKFLDYKNKL